VAEPYEPKPFKKSKKQSRGISSTGTESEAIVGTPFRKTSGGGSSSSKDGGSYKSEGLLSQTGHVFSDAIGGIDDLFSAAGQTALAAPRLAYRLGRAAVSDGYGMEDVADIQGVDEEDERKGLLGAYDYLRQEVPLVTGLVDSTIEGARTGVAWGAEREGLVGPAANTIPGVKKYIFNPALEAITNDADEARLREKVVERPVQSMVDVAGTVAIGAGTAGKLLGGTKYLALANEAEALTASAKALTTSAAKESSALRAAAESAAKAGDAAESASYLAKADQVVAKAAAEADKLETAAAATKQVVDDFRSSTRGKAADAADKISGAANRFDPINVSVEGVGQGLKFVGGKGAAKFGDGTTLGRASATLARAGQGLADTASGVNSARTAAATSRRLQNAELSPVARLGQKFRDVLRDDEAMSAEVLVDSDVVGFYDGNPLLEGLRRGDDLAVQDMQVRFGKELGVGEQQMFSPADIVRAVEYRRGLLDKKTAGRIDRARAFRRELNAIREPDYLSGRGEADLAKLNPYEQKQVLDRRRAEVEASAPTDMTIRGVKDVRRAQSKLNKSQKGLARLDAALERAQARVVAGLEDRASIVKRAASAPEAARALAEDMLATDPELALAIAKGRKGGLPTVEQLTNRILFGMNTAAQGRAVKGALGSVIDEVGAAPASGLRRPKMKTTALKREGVAAERLRQAERRVKQTEAQAAKDLSAAQRQVLETYSKAADVVDQVAAEGARAVAAAEDKLSRALDERDRAAAAPDLSTSPVAQERLRRARQDINTARAERNRVRSAAERRIATAEESARISAGEADRLRRSLEADVRRAQERLVKAYKRRKKASERARKSSDPAEVARLKQEARDAAIEAGGAFKELQRTQRAAEAANARAELAAERMVAAAEDSMARTELRGEAAAARAREGVSAAEDSYLGALEKSDQAAADFAVASAAADGRAAERVSRGAAEAQRRVDVVRDLQVRRDRAARVVQRAQDSLDEAIRVATEDPKNAPARYKPALMGAKRSIEFLQEKAAKLPEDSPQRALLEESIAFQSEQMVEIFKAVERPEYIHGGYVDDPTLGTRLGRTPQSGVRKVSSTKQTTVGLLPRTIAQELSFELRDRRIKAGNMAIRTLMDQFAKNGSQVGEELLGNPKARAAELGQAARTRDLVPVSESNVAAVLKDADITPDTMFIPAALQRSLASEMKMLTPNNWELGARLLIDKPTTAWKTLTLPLSVRWHLGNLIGNIMILSVSGQVPLLKIAELVPAAYRLRKQILEGGDVAPELRTLIDDGMANELIKEKNGDGINTRPDWAQPLRAKTGKSAVEWSYHMNEFVDQMGRLVDYLDGTKNRGWTSARAVDHAHRILGEYNRMSPLERSVLKRIFPFYQWTRTITADIMRLPLENPMRTAWMLALASSFEADPELPSYYMGRALSPGGLLFPTSSYIPYLPGTVAPDSLVGGVNPLMKVAYTQATGKRFPGPMGDMDLPKYVDFDSVRGDVLREDLLNLTPWTRVINNPNGERRDAAGVQKVYDGEPMMKPRWEDGPLAGLPYFTEEAARNFGVPYPIYFNAEVAAQQRASKEYQDWKANQKRRAKDQAQKKAKS